MELISSHERTARLSGPPKNEHPPIEVSAGRRESQARSGRESPCGRPATIPGDSLREQCAGEQEDYFATDDLTSRATTRRRRRLRETVSLGGRVSFLAVVAISLLASAACGGAGQARGDAPVVDPEGAQETGVQERTPDAEGTVEGDGKDRAVARAGDAEARADGGAARAGNARAGTGDAQARTGGAVITGNSKGGGAGNVEGKDGPQEVTLRVTGDPGTAFSGACSVGGKERTLDGGAPKLYAFETRGKKLECEVRKEGGGALGIVFTDGEGVRSEQQIDGGGGTVTFAYSNGSFSSSTSSVSVSRAVTSSARSSSNGSR